LISWWHCSHILSPVPGLPQLGWQRLPPTAVRMNHERLPRHCFYRATSSMTSREQIWHTDGLIILSRIVLAKFSITSREIFWLILTFHAN
jgi:hypothetical protein